MLDIAVRAVTCCDSPGKNFATTRNKEAYFLSMDFQSIKQVIVGQMSAQSKVITLLRLNKLFKLWIATVEKLLLRPQQFATNIPTT